MQHDQDRGPRRRMPRRPLRLLLLCTTALALLAGAVVVTAYLRRSTPVEVSVDDAVREFRRSEDGGGGVLRPGVLRAEGTGSNELERPPVRQTDGPTMPVTVRPIANDCSTWRIDYNSSHFQGLDICRTGGAVRITAQRTGQTWDFGVAAVSNLSEFRCDPAIDVSSSGGRLARARTTTCTGSNSAVGGAATVELHIEDLGDATIDVGGTPVAAVGQRWTQRLAGDQSGTLRDEWWFDSSNGLPLRAERTYSLTTPTPLGSVRYTESGSWVLAGLERTR